MPSLAKPSSAVFVLFSGGLLAVLGGFSQSSGAEPAVAPSAAPAVDDSTEVVFTDGSVLRLTILPKHLTLVTAYGKLTIPVKALRRVEVATRVDEDVSRSVAAAIADLASPEFARREKATAELLRLREKAYPGLLDATEQKDPEVGRRIEELVEQIRRAVPAERLEVRKQDLVYTEDSKNTGRLEDTVLPVRTTQFGEVRMKLSDVRTLRVPGEVSNEAAPTAGADPGNLNTFANQAGQVLAFRVTGNADGPVWGSDAYTIDSRLATAAVHAGLVAPGQTAVVKVKVLPMVAAYQGSTRNGVTTAPYGPYSGFQFVRGRVRED